MRREHRLGTGWVLPGARPPIVVPALLVRRHIRVTTQGAIKG
ncbi:hypothetical protein [Streptosporangium sp. OZ121]